MNKIVLSTKEKQLANYIVDKNKNELNKISPDCTSTLIAIRKACKNTIVAIGKTELESQNPLTHDEYLKITRWIMQTFFEYL